MGVEFLKTKKYQSIDSSELFNACLKISDLKGFKLLKKDDTQSSLVFGTTMSIYSWGEVIGIQIKKFDNITELEVKSKSKLKTTIADWGKNKRNVEKIMNLINTLIPTSTIN
jgi:hypothetical protein